MKTAIKVLAMCVVAVVVGAGSVLATHNLLLGDVDPDKDDLIDLKTGADEIDFGSGADKIEFQAGNDFVWFGSGDEGIFFTDYSLGNNEYVGVDEDTSSATDDTLLINGDAVEINVHHEDLVINLGS